MLVFMVEICVRNELVDELGETSNFVAILIRVAEG